MKKVVLFGVAIMFVFTMQAQHVFNKGGIWMNAGIGAPSTNGYIPTVNFSGEIGVIPTGTIGLIAFGGLAEFQFGQYDFGSSKEGFPRFYFGPRATWHVQAFTSAVFDAYVGVGAGISISGKTDHFAAKTAVNPDVFVGGRWMFQPAMGLFAEAGFSGLSLFKFGITFGF